MIAGKEQITSAWSKWFRRYTKDVAARECDFHAFRHTWKRQARLCGVFEEHSDAITGHASDSVGRAYGSAEGFPLKPLAEAIAKVRYEGLKLPKSAA